MANQNQSENEYITIDDVAKDDTNYNYLHLSDVSPTSDSIAHKTKEQHTDDVHHYQPLEKGNTREEHNRKSHKKATSEEAKPPKSHLPPWWGWLLIVIGISLLCVMVALLVVFLKGKPVYR